MTLPVVVEFGAHGINIGLAGDGLPSRTIDAASILTVQRSGAHDDLSSNSTQRPVVHSQRDDGGFDVLLDHEAYNYQRGSSAFAADPPHHRHLFAASQDNNNMLPGDTEIAAAALRCALARESLDESTDLIAVVPDQVLANDQTFRAWAEVFFAAGFRRFFPLRGAVAATLESARPSAVVLDVGFRSARVRLVQDGYQVGGSSSSGNGSGNSGLLVADSELLSGRLVSQIFERDFVECAVAAATIQQQNKNGGGPALGSQQDGASASQSSQQHQRGGANAFVDSIFRGYLPPRVSAFGWPSSSTAVDPVEASNSPHASAAAFAPAQLTLHRNRVLREARQRLGCFAGSRMMFQATAKQHEGSGNGAGNNNNGNDDDDDPFAMPAAKQQQDFSANAAGPVVGDATFVAPDGNEITLSGYARCAAFEHLFSGSGHHQLHLNNGGGGGAQTLPALVKQQYAVLPPDIRVTVPLLVVGGLARADGFRARFAKELQGYDSFFAAISARFATDPHPQWRGASFVGAAATASAAQQHCWVTEQAMQERGAANLRAWMP
jgi:hypothetical protein